MTDPLDDFLMPYSAPMIPVEGTDFFRIPEEYRNSVATASLRLWVPPGVSMVRLTWDGPDAIQAMFGRDIGSIAWRTIITLPAGVAGESRSGVAEVSTDMNSWFLVRGVSSIPASTVESGFRAGLTVIPM